MKMTLSILLAVAMLGSLVLAQDAPSQDATSQDSAAILAEFTRTVELMNGLTLNFVHVNNRTADIIFAGPEKYSMKARSNMMTLIYVQGISEKPVQLHTEYVMESGGDTIVGTSHNIKNFEDGTSAVGERIDGLLMFAKKLEPSNSFVLKGSDATVSFEFSDAALRLLGN